MPTTKAQTSLRIRAVWSASLLFAALIYNIIPLVPISEILSLYLASEAEQPDLNLTWSQTPKTGFLVTRLIYLIYEADANEIYLQLNIYAHKREYRRLCSYSANSFFIIFTDNGR